ncbi:response regulator [Telmatobacter bradus]|uniref:response regulator n=1 Tax=Telmatobacter bradus TaxID=474953 RepID=UPI003B438880
MADRILFVDDEQGVLDGYERLLRKDFHVYVARGGLEGLEAMEKYGPFAVVISDMRMPGMNGAEFLAQVRQKEPSTVRMLLTGFTDLSAAIDAVNEGNIFRFLTKPCRKEILVEAINIGIAQHHSITAEKDLIKKAQATEQLTPEPYDEDICQWDNFEGPTGLPGPSQARGLLAPLFGVDSKCYVVLLTLTALQTLERRYGEESAGDYLNIAAQFLMQSLRSEDRLFHWERDVLMAVMRRQISPAAMRLEIVRLTSASREHVMEVNGRSIMVASPITFDLLPISQFSTFDEMLAAFHANVSKKV